MSHLSPLAWIGIGLICAIVVLMNVGLIAFLRYKPKLEIKPPKQQASLRMDRMLEVIKDPFGEERKQIDTLSELVEQIKKTDQE